MQKSVYQRKPSSNLRWWKNNIDEIYNGIIVPNPAVEIKIDASLNGWGAVTEKHKETQNHINVLELKTILFGLKSQVRHIRLAHIKILCDISTSNATLEVPPLCP